MWLTVAARRGCSDRDLGFIAYVPGQTELRADTRISFYEQCVGRVTTVEPGLQAVQLNVERVGALPDRESLTVSARDPEATVQDGPLTLTYVSAGSIRIQGPGAEDRTLTRQSDGLWSVDGAAVGRIGRARGQPRPSGCASQPRAGGAGVVRRGPLHPRDRVHRRVGIRDGGEQRGLVPELASLESSLGAGTAIRVGSPIGINMTGPPQVRLVPSFTNTSLVADRSGVQEFSPLAGTDVLAFLGEAVDYLSAPGLSDAPPVNRYERLVDDLGGSLAEMRAAVSSARRFADTLGAVADAGGDQLAGRLVLGSRQLDVLEGALIQHRHRAHHD